MSAVQSHLLLKLSKFSSDAAVYFKALILPSVVLLMFFKAYIALLKPYSYFVVEHEFLLEEM